MKFDFSKPSKSTIAFITILSICLSMIVISTSATGDGFGTYEDGVKFTTMGDIYKQTPVDGFQNADFSSGFRFWGSKQANSFASTNGNLVTVDSGTANENTYLETDAQTAYHQISSWPFKLTGVTAGDKLAVVYKWKGSNTACVDLNQINSSGGATKITSTRYNQSNIHILKAAATSDGWNIVIAKDVASTVAASENYVFNVDIKDSQLGTVSHGNIDDLIIVKIGTDNKLYNLDGTEYDPNASSDESDEDVDTDGYGTKKDGLRKDLITRTMSPITAPKNLDFSEGFRYWGTYWNGSTASDFAELVTENGNTYAKLKPKADDGSNGWRGPSCVPFYVSADKIHPGESLSVMYDWKGDTTCAVKLFQLDQESGGDRKLADSDPTKNVVVSGETEDDWNTSVQWSCATVGEDLTDDGKYAFFIMFQPAGDVSIETYFDNFRLVKVKGGLGSYEVYDLDDNRITFEPDTDDDGYGTKKDGLRKEIITRTMNPIDAPKNMDFSEGFRYWGTYWSDSTASTYAEIITDGTNSYAKLKPDPTDPSTYKGPSSVPFYISADKVHPGESLSVMYDWKGDATCMVKLVQLDQESGDGRKLADSDPTKNIVVYGETENDWNKSVQWSCATLSEDLTDDGKYAFFIMFQPAGTNEVNVCFDNFQVVKVKGEFGSYEVYDLDDNLLTFNTENEDEDDGEDEDGVFGDNTNGGYTDTDNSGSTSGNTGSIGGNTGSSGGNNNIGSNTNNNNYVYNGVVNADTIDITPCMEKITELMNGEAVKFIPLFDIKSVVGDMNAYISVDALTKDQLEIVKKLDGKTLNNIAVTLRAIMSTMNNTPNMDNAKAFAKLGGKPANTLPLCFMGHINLDFPVNVRVKMAAGSLDVNKKYYAYRCDSNTRVIDNLGQVHLEETDGNIYLTITTDDFADFFITPDKLKSNEPATVTEPTSNNLVVWIIVGAAALLLIAAAIVVIILIAKKKRT